MKKIFSILRWFFYLFTPYVHPFERKTEKFFRWVTSYRSREEVARRLLELMQENLLMFNVWLEKRFKNYGHLSKRQRRKMYANAKKIEADFEAFRRGYAIDSAKLRAHLEQLGVEMGEAELPSLLCLAALTAYFNPNTRFHYQEQSAFWKLLVDPAQEKMVGDCNQIVTLYAHLFSRVFPLHSLQIKLIPGHVCLHYKGLDIEATKGTFRKYDSYDIIAPISELISTNLLDITDPREAARSIEPKHFVKAAQLASAISSKREVVEHNLHVAYQKLCLEAIREHDFDRANFWADALGDATLKRSCLGQEFNWLAEKVRGVKTIRDAKPHRSTYVRMRTLARELSDAKNIQYLDKMISQL